MRFGLLVPIVAIAALSQVACSYLRPSCDSPKLLDELRMLIAGQVNNQHEILTIGDAASLWLRETIEITVMNQTSDDTRRHIACTATVTIPSKVSDEAPGILRLDVTETIHYGLIFQPQSTTPAIILTPKSEPEQTWMALLQETLREILKAESYKDPRPVTDRTTSNAKGPDEAGAGTGDAKLTKGPSNPENGSIADFKGGKYHRTSPAPADLEISEEGDNWRIHVVSGGYAANAEATPADCELEEVGTLQGNTIVAHLVPFDTALDTVSENDIKDIGNMVITVRDDGVTVDEAPYGDICARHSDATGEYGRIEK